MNSFAAAAGSFSPTLQFEKAEIHTVFLAFPNFHLVQNLSSAALADLIIGYYQGAATKRSFYNADKMLQVTAAVSVKRLGDS